MDSKRKSDSKSPNQTQTVQLTSQQQAVVNHDTGPALVFAVAGAGKTTSMVQRIERLARERIFAPEQILATSFGTSNVRELQDSLKPWPHCRQVHTRTLHALGRDIMVTAQHMGYLNHLDLTGNGNNPSSLAYKLLGKTISKAHKREVYFQQELNTLDRNDFLDYVAMCKGNLKYPALSEAKLSPRGRQIAQQAKPPSLNLAWYLDLYQLYEQVRLSEGIVTFDDMLFTGWELLVTYPDVLKQIQNRFQCVLVDEFQDINLAQAEMLHLITQSHRNYMAIGDDDQTIYEWRGANPQFILDFPKRYQAQVYLINENFRCPVGALTLANEVIRHNKKRQSKRLQLTQGFHGQINLTFVPTLTAMAAKIANRIEQLHGAGQSLDTIAILVRLNAQTPALEHALITRKIPYHSNSPFYERQEIQTLILYCRLAWAERQLLKGDTLSPAMLDSALSGWDQIVNQPKRYVSNAYRERLKHLMDLSGRPFSETITEFSQSVSEEWLGEILQKLATDLNWLAQNLETEASQALQKFVKRLDYLDFLKSASGSVESGADKVAGVESFIAYAAGQGTLLQFLQNVRQLSEQRQTETGMGAAVTLSTIHRAKGLEWAHVFIPQCNQKTIPFSKYEAPNLEEERRLFYVALTRTQQNVFLYCLEKEPISQFLTEAKWHKTIETVQAVQNLLRKPIKRWQAADALQLAQANMLYEWQSYFQNWWDTTQSANGELAQQMAAFCSFVRQHKLEKRYKLSNASLLTWPTLTQPSQSTKLIDFSSLANPVAKPVRQQSKKQKRPPSSAKAPSDMIRIGTWVQCDAGWGQISGITNSQGMKMLTVSNTNRSVRLSVILRPNDDAVLIEIDCTSNSIRFLEAGKVYTCTLCHQFSTMNPHIIAKLHSNTAHDGKIAFRPEKEKKRKLTTLVNIQGQAIFA
jgi:DNA helicase II / ATP-dependent DNA helicase PcrA